MERIIPIIGNVKYKITLDPSVWLLDDRKRPLDDFFNNPIPEENSLEEYTKKVSEHWDRELIEGATPPSEKRAEKSFQKVALKTETFAINLHYFLHNCEPNSDAKEFIIHTANGNRTFPLAEAYHFVLCFSLQGKAIVEDGPVHVYYSDSKDHFITHVTAFEIV